VCEKKIELVTKMFADFERVDKKDWIDVPAICVCAEVAPGVVSIDRIKADVRFSIKASSSESSTDGCCVW